MSEADAPTPLPKSRLVAVTVQSATTLIVTSNLAVAGLAALQCLAKAPGQAAELGLNGSSRVLLVSTEGATAPGVYAELVGESAESVLGRQREWLARTR